MALKLAAQALHLHQLVLGGSSRIEVCQRGLVADAQLVRALWAHQLLASPDCQPVRRTAIREPPGDYSATAPLGCCGITNSRAWLNLQRFSTSRQKPSRLVRLTRRGIS